VTNPADRPPPVHPANSVSAPVANDRAPFVYFEKAFAYGIMQPSVQVELAGRTIIPGSGGATPGEEMVVTAHVRCSPNAAHDLMRALEGALNMLKRPEGAAN
jgi:hypothetical protein